MNLTNEQVHAVDLFGKSKSLKISAFAGTGKTSTLSALARSTHSRGLYLAFNKSIAEEATGKFPRTVACRTTHSVAYSSVADLMNGNRAKLTNKLQINQVSDLLKLNELPIGKVTIKKNAIGRLIIDTIERFCHSSDVGIDHRHVPMTGRLRQLDIKDQTPFKVYIAELAAHLWKWMRDPKESAPLGHAGYLKLWSLSKPRLAYDFVLLDEAQDTNEAVLSVLRGQDCPLTLVGDRHQQIYEWRGAVNAMTNVATDAEAFLTQSFRFGEKLATAATAILRDLKETRSLRGDPTKITKISTTERTRTTLCRTKSGVVEIVANALLEGRSPHVVGGVNDLVRLLEDVTRLRNKIPAESHEFYGFQDWNEVIDYANSEEGAEFKSFVKIVATHGENPLIEKLNLLPKEESAANMIISTGHKSKGREWDSVTLHSDFDLRLKWDPQTKSLANEEEARILYVAVTRARNLLVVPNQLAAMWNGSAPMLAGQRSDSTRAVPLARISSGPRSELAALPKPLATSPSEPSATTAPAAGPKQARPPRAAPTGNPLPLLDSDAKSAKPRRRDTRQVDLPLIPKPVNVASSGPAAGYTTTAARPDPARLQVATQEKIAAGPLDTLAQSARPLQQEFRRAGSASLGKRFAGPTSESASNTAPSARPRPAGLTRTAPAKSSVPPVAPNRRSPLRPELHRAGGGTVKGFFAKVANILLGGK